MKVANVKGTRDIPPEEQIIREQIIETIRKTFQKYGFVPLETPALEHFDVLAAKEMGGEELVKETYNFEIAGRRLGLRYDLTVPLARYIAMNPQLRMPFKRYQYGSNWRYGEVLMQRGRYREFFQFDIDTIGISGVEADSEILAAAIDAYRSLGLKDFVIRINDRQLVQEIATSIGLKDDQMTIALRSIDKLDKTPVDKVLTEMVKNGIQEDVAQRLLKTLDARGVPKEILKRYEEYSEAAGYQNLVKIVELLEIYGLGEFLVLDLSLVRGQAYYTGPVFEVGLKNLDFRSIGGGGRYDDMIGVFSGKIIPATGISIGIDALMDAMKKLGLIKPKKTPALVYIGTVNMDCIPKALEVATVIRGGNVPVEVELLPRSVKKQMIYANKQGFEYLIIIGPKEVETNEFTLKNMITRETVPVTLTTLPSHFPNE